MLISIIIPAFQEERAIDAHLKMICQFADSQAFASEILVVDDGSRDQTAALVRQAARRDSRVRLISLAENRGKGFAVKTGLLAAKGEIRGFTDADGSTPIEEILRVLPYFEKQAQVVIGSRAKRSPDTQVKAYAHRRIMGRVFNNLLQTGLNLKDQQGKMIQDTQCGFKWFSSSAAEKIFSKMTVDGFAFDVEALYLAKRFQMEIVELPVNWADRGHSHVNLFMDPLKMIGQVLTITWRHRRTLTS